MSDSDLIAQFLGSCFSGALGAAECGPLWYLLVIGLLVFAGVSILIGLRMRGAGASRDKRK